VVSAFVYVVALLDLSRRRRDLAAAIVALGGLAYLAGCVRWATGSPIFVVLPFWTTWLVLTIAGERLELTRVMPPSPVARISLVVASSRSTWGLVMRVVGDLAGISVLRAWGGLVNAIAIPRVYGRDRRRRLTPRQKRPYSGRSWPRRE
jgi:hypothetical protein